MGQLPLSLDSWTLSHRRDSAWRRLVLALSCESSGSQPGASRGLKSAASSGHPSGIDRDPVNHRRKNIAPPSTRRPSESCPTDGAPEPVRQEERAGHDGDVGRHRAGCRQGHAREEVVAAREHRQRELNREQQDHRCDRRGARRATSRSSDREQQREDEAERVADQESATSESPAPRPPTTTRARAAVRPSERSTNAATAGPTSPAPGDRGGRDAAEGACSRAPRRWRQRRAGASRSVRRGAPRPGRAPARGPASRPGPAARRWSGRTAPRRAAP